LSSPAAAGVAILGARRDLAWRWSVASHGASVRVAERIRVRQLSRRIADLASPAANTIVVGAIATAHSRWRSRASRPSNDAGDRPPPALAPLYPPLLVPQVAFLFGAQVCSCAPAGWRGGRGRGRI
jgi:hypothetical protein